MKLHKTITIQQGKRQVLNFPVFLLFILSGLFISQGAFANTPDEDDDAYKTFKSESRTTLLVDVESELVMEDWMTDIRETEWASETEAQISIENWMVETENKEWFSTCQDDPEACLEEWMLKPNRWL